MVVSDGLASEAESLLDVPFDDVVAPMALSLVAATALVGSEPATSCGVEFCEESVRVTAPVDGSVALREIEPSVPAEELAPGEDTVTATGSASTVAGVLTTARAGATTGDSAAIVSLALVCGAAMLPSALWRSCTAEAAIWDWVGPDWIVSGALIESTPAAGWGVTEAGAVGAGAALVVSVLVSVVDWDDGGATLSEPGLAGWGATESDVDAAWVPSVDGAAS